MARQFGCQHHEIVVEPNAAELLPKLVWHMDEPTADPAIIMAYLVCREARKDATVLLSGVGGDELFAGYRKHFAYYWAQAYRKVPAWLRRGVFEPLVDALPSMRHTRFKGQVRLVKKMVRSGALDRESSFLMNSTYFDDGQRARLYDSRTAALVGSHRPWGRHRDYFDQVKDADFLNQMLYLDTRAFMVSLNLNYTDKMSMAASVEVRVPFLDRELAEFAAWQIPPAMKLKGRLQPTGKYILRKAMQGIVPSEVMDQPKAGFGAPIDYWLAHDLDEMTREFLSPRQIHQRGLFSPIEVQEYLDLHRGGQQDWAYHIWALLTLECWMRIFMDADPVSFAASLATALPM